VYFSYYLLLKSSFAKIHLNIINHSMTRNFRYTKNFCYLLFCRSEFHRITTHTFVIGCNSKETMKAKHCCDSIGIIVTMHRANQTELKSTWLWFVEEQRVMRALIDVRRALHVQTKARSNRVGQQISNNEFRRARPPTDL